jgi:ribosomal protein S18 acetylase RimI-like enzyme
MTDLQPARFPDEKTLVQSLFREYRQWLAIDLDFQSFDAEMASLSGKYAPPTGNIILARAGGEIAGCICWYELEKTICEIKRLYVRPGFRGRGIGKALMDYAIDAIRATGYEKLRLDSLERLAGAKKLYERFAFRPIAPYNYNPCPDVYYLELELSAKMEKTA